MLKKREMFLASWVNSYRELKELDRRYHEFVVSERRRPYYTEDTYYDEFENVKMNEVEID